MSHYILVHGAWEESQSWGRVVPILEQRGHTVTAIDLPGHGVNEQPISCVTMAAYIQSIVDVITRLGHRVILVGHSMSGAVISGVAERIPEHIERLIYVAAYLLQDGDSVLEAMKRDPDGQLLPEVVFSEDQSAAVVSEETLRRVGFHDVDEQVIQRIMPLMSESQATEPFVAKVAVSDDRFGSVPKTYIRTTLDRITSPALQDSMLSGWSVERVHDLESGHFPALSVPGRLADLMV